MILNYVALALLLSALTTIFYTFIYIHDIPYDIAKKRNHPHAEAIHIACWLSLFTLHAIWPIVFIWAVMKQEPLKANPGGEAGAAIGDIANRLSALEERLKRIEVTKAAKE